MSMCQNCGYYCGCRNSKPLSEYDKKRMLAEEEFFKQESNEDKKHRLSYTYKKYFCDFLFVVITFSIFPILFFACFLESIVLYFSSILICIPIHFIIKNSIFFEKKAKERLIYFLNNKGIY